jgi:hypothetical protein
MTLDHTQTIDASGFRCSDQIGEKLCISVETGRPRGPSLKERAKAAKVQERANAIEQALQAHDPAQQGMGVMQIRTAAGISGGNWATAFAECRRRGSVVALECEKPPKLRFVAETERAERRAAETRAHHEAADAKRGPWWRKAAGHPAATG